MTSDLFERCCDVLFGPGWVPAQVATAFHVQLPTACAWLVGTRDVPPGVCTEIRGMLQDKRLLLDVVAQEMDEEA